MLRRGTFETGTARLFVPDFQNFMRGALGMALFALVCLGQRKQGDCMNKGEAGEVKPGID
jgi:hypothetical protein